MQLQWRLVGRGLHNPQILAHDPHGGVLAINRVMYTGQPDSWWLTGPNYGLGTEHESQDDAKAAAQRWGAVLGFGRATHTRQEGA